MELRAGGACMAREDEEAELCRLADAHELSVEAAVKARDAALRRLSALTGVYLPKDLRVKMEGLQKRAGQQLQAADAAVNAAAQLQARSRALQTALREHAADAATAHRALSHPWDPPSPTSSLISNLSSEAVSAELAPVALWAVPHPSQWPGTEWPERIRRLKPLEMALLHRQHLRYVGSMQREVEVFGLDSVHGPAFVAHCRFYAAFSKALQQHNLGVFTHRYGSDMESLLPAQPVPFHRLCERFLARLQCIDRRLVAMFVSAFRHYRMRVSELLQERALLKEELRQRAAAAEAPSPRHAPPVPRQRPTAAADGVGDDKDNGPTCSGSASSRASSRQQEDGPGGATSSRAVGASTSPPSAAAAPAPVAAASFRVSPEAGIDFMDDLAARIRDNLHLQQKAAMELWYTSTLSQPTLLPLDHLIGFTLEFYPTPVNLMDSVIRCTEALDHRLDAALGLDPVGRAG